MKSRTQHLRQLQTNEKLQINYAIRFAHIELKSNFKQKNSNINNQITTNKATKSMF